MNNYVEVNEDKDAIFNIFVANHRLGTKEKVGQSRTWVDGLYMVKGLNASKLDKDLEYFQEKI